MVILRDKDYMTYIVRYIDRNTSKGYNKDQLRLMLLNQGYSRAAVERAFRLYDEQKPKVKPVVKEEPKVTVPVEEAPKKRGFFARLFGLGKKKKEEEELVKVEVIN